MTDSSSLGINIAYIINILLPYTKNKDAGPVVLGLTGLQGSGKSTWADTLVKTLNEQYKLRSIAISLDDFYYCRDDLVRLRDADRGNLIYRTRGQPGSHDEELARNIFSSLTTGGNTGVRIQIPVFDKSLFNGQGDRIPISRWPAVTLPVDVVVFEGWCIGFSPLHSHEVEARWRAAKDKSLSSPTTSGQPSTLARHRLEDLLQMNSSLTRYCTSFMGPQFFHILVHLDTDDPMNVYKWRIQQERMLIRTKGSGMTDEQVTEFVNVYMPSYELYLDQLRRGFFRDQAAKERKVHIRILLDVERKIVDSQKL